MAHAKYFQPSSGDRIEACPASAPLNALAKDKPSFDSSQGTAAHTLGSTVLTTPGDTCANHIGEEIVADGLTFTVDAEMAMYVQQYVDYVRSLHGFSTFIEVKLPIGFLTREEGASGTGDAIVLISGDAKSGDELAVVDLKYGMGVRVDALGNRQLQAYGLAALEEYGLLADVKRVRLVIVQPRLGHISEVVYTVEEMAAFREDFRRIVDRMWSAIEFHQANGTIHEKYFGPSEKGCKFCKVKADCPALQAQVLATVTDGFADLTQPLAPQIQDPKEVEIDNAILGNLMSAVGLIEDWCKGIRAKCEGELLAGRATPGWKLVQGRQGNRAWTSADEVERLFKDTFRLKVQEMYDLSLISPTSAEKLTKLTGEDGKPLLGPRQWKKVQDLITRSEGKPSVAPESDRRPALNLAVDLDAFPTIPPVAMVTDPEESLV